MYDQHLLCHVLIAKGKTDESMFLCMESSCSTIHWGQWRETLITLRETFTVYNLFVSIDAWRVLEHICWIQTQGWSDNTTKSSLWALHKLISTLECSAVTARKKKKKLKPAENKEQHHLGRRIKAIVLIRKWKFCHFFADKSLHTSSFNNN